ncbi:hypothetical protein H6P81_012697 [Aristolochia fimbriata]|uniref:Cytochrome P450 n=1 Tax=Aristolochia fimbriata TaxID=158543 RepID=A0AAV7ECX3_ARIFI|nr:hypothetical protein H6P81_012697 [Aristolochia fimbriata]
MSGTGRNKRGTGSFKHPPGPVQLPVIGNLHLMLGDLPHRTLLSLSRKHRAPLMYLKLGQVPTVVASSPETAREVLKSLELEFCDRSNYPQEKTLTYNFSDVAYASHGREWRELRKVCVHQLLTSTKVRSMARFTYHLVHKMLIRSVSDSSASVKAVNLTEVLRTFTTDLVCKAVFGEKFKWEDEEEKRRFYEGLLETQLLLGASFLADGLPWLGWIDAVTGLGRRLRNNFAEMDYFYEKVIKHHEQQQLPHDHHPDPNEEEFVDVMLRAVKQLHLTRDHVKAILMDLLVGGTDSSAATVEWAMAELMRNPSAMKKLQDEIRGAVLLERKEGGSKGVDETHLPHLAYLRLVVKETLRLHPPTPLLIPRENKRHCVVDGYDVFPKTRVIVNALAVGLDPESWDDPEEFRPERFRNTDDAVVDYMRSTGQDFRFLPFGAGRRGCPGAMFGLTTVELALANLLCCFDWELPGGMSKEELSMEETYDSVVQRKKPLLLVPVKKFNELVD